MSEAAQPVRMFVVYQNPKDFPERFVVREWNVLEGGVELAISPPKAVTTTLALARRKGIPAWAVKLDRSPQDDPAIREIWI